MAKEKKTKKVAEEQSQVVENKASEAEPAQPQVLSLEQVATMAADKLVPNYKPSHLNGLLAFCNHKGYPTSGTSEQMLDVMKQYGYILK
jgi:hypothetical protein